MQELEERQEKLRELVKQLPECHHATAKMLFKHLVKVANNAEVNKVIIQFNTLTPGDIVKGPHIYTAHFRSQFSILCGRT